MVLALRGSSMVLAGGNVHTSERCQGAGGAAPSQGGASRPRLLLRLPAASEGAGDVIRRGLLRTPRAFWAILVFFVFFSRQCAAHSEEG
eukprot:6742723-Pyramimonas_sp.AAC.1